MSQTPPTEPDVFGKNMLTAMIGFVGVCIVAFGMLQVIQGQFITGGIITFIGLSDLVILAFIRKKL